MMLPDYIKKIMSVYEQNGYLCYVVGGAVRDSLLNNKPSDYDLATNALPDVSMGMFEKTISTGLKHGTITVMMDEHAVEVTTFRIDGDYVDNRHPESVTFTADLKEDLMRRDFTVNSIAYNEKEGYIDFFDGILDIERKIVKAVGNPHERFKEDGLRMIRAIRFSAKLGFSIEDNTLNAISELSYLIQNISKERIKDELDKILMSQKKEYIKYLYDTGLMQHLEVPYLCYDKENMEKAIYNLSCYKGESLTVCYTLWLMYVPYEHLKDIMKTLKFDNKTLNDVLLYSEQLHTEFIADEYNIRKTLHKTGYDALVNILDTKRIVDNSFDKGGYKRSLMEIVKRKDPITLKHLAINGEDLKSYEFSGEEIGKCLNVLLDMVHKDPSLNQKERLMAIVTERKDNCDFRTF